MTTDVINGVPRDDLDLIRAVLEGFNPCMARDDALRTVRRLLATAQPADHSEHALNMAAQPAADGERGAFESWLSSLKFVSGQGQAHVEYCLHRDLSDKYTTEWVSDMYRGWQARAAQPQQAVAVTDEVGRLREALTKAKGVLEEVWEFSYEHGAASALSARDMAEEISAVLSAHKTGEE